MPILEVLGSSFKVLGAVNGVVRIGNAIDNVGDIELLSPG
jgi:hypothetical protein